MKKFFLAYLKQPPLFQNSKFCAKIRILKFGTKNKCLIWVFWAATLKNIFHIWNQRSWICLIAKYGGKTKILKFGTKNSFFGYFWVEILKSCCYILNDPLQICLISKLFERMEIIKFENKNALFVYFWGRGFKNCCHIWNPLSLSSCKILRKNEKIPDQNSGSKMPYLGIFGLQF